MRAFYLGEAGATSALLAVLLHLSREHAGTPLSHFLCCLAAIAVAIIVAAIHEHNKLDPVPIVVRGDFSSEVGSNVIWAEFTRVSETDVK